MREHRGALEYDLATRVGSSVTAILRQEIPWQLAWGWVGALISDHHSHTYAALRGWDYVPSPSEVATYDWWDLQRLMRRQKGQLAPKPTRRPWESRKPQAAPAKLDQKSRERRERLAAMF